jgi:hypothetical protein
MKDRSKGGRDRRFVQSGGWAHRRHRAEAEISVPPELRDAMRKLRGAVGNRLRKGPMDQTTAGAIARILDTVAQAVEAH